MLLDFILEVNILSKIIIIMSCYLGEYSYVVICYILNICKIFYYIYMVMDLIIWGWEEVDNGL